MPSTKSMDFTQWLHYLDAGDSGAEQAILTLMDADDPHKMLKTLHKLDDLDIRGEKIFNIFAECNADAQEFFKVVEEL